MDNTSEKQKTDSELVRDTIKNGDNFIEIVRRYESPLRRYVVRLGCRDNEDANDLLQDIFIKIYVNIYDYDTRLKFSSWIYRIAHNEAVSFYRKKSIRPRATGTEEERSLIANFPDEVNFLEALDANVDRIILWEALGELDDNYRGILILRFMEDKSYSEISDILKIPEGTVGTLLNRGKKLLKSILFSKK